MTRQSRRPRVLEPFYVALGATDLALEKLQHIGAQAAGHDADEPAASRVDQVTRTIMGARQVPAMALNQAIDTAVRAQEQYAGLVERGQRLTSRQRPLQQTGDVARQAEETVEAVAHPTRPGSVARPTRAAGSPKGAAGSPAGAASSDAVADPGRSAASGAADRPRPRRPRVSSARSAGAALASPTGSAARPTAEQSGHTRAVRSVSAGSRVDAGATVPKKRSVPKAVEAVESVESAGVAEAKAAGVAEPQKDSPKSTAKRSPAKKPAGRRAAGTSAGSGSPAAAEPATRASAGPEAAPEE